MNTQVNVPIVIIYGRRYIHEYGIQEYIASLKRSFIDCGADFIVLDSNARGQKFLYACASWAMEQNIIHNNLNIDDSQSSIYSFRLTDFGRKYLEDES